MAAKAATVLYSKCGTVAQIVLNRPHVINAYSVQMRDDLFQVLQAVRDDPDVRVAILRGVGERGFCAGADLTEFGTFPSQVIARRVRWERDIWGLFLSIRKPLIAALHGHVVGSGVELACLCDLRIASKDTVFQMPEVALGMIPAAGGTQAIARIVGRGPALEMMLSSRQITAQEARRLGLVHEVVPRRELLGRAEELAEILASRSSSAVVAAKAAVTEGVDLPLEMGLDLEHRLAIGVMRESECR